MTNPAEARCAMLERMVEAKPDDAFARYGLAMEYRRQGRADDALEQFRTLAQKVPDYVPQYLMHGQLLRERGQTDAAKAVLTEGCTRALAAGDNHAHSELQDELGELS